MSHSALNSFDDFYQLLADSLAKNSLIKLLLSKYRGADKSLQRITIRPISLQNEPVLSFVYQHQTNHITKNLSYDEGLASIKLLLGNDFKSAHLATAQAEVQLEISKKGKVQISTHNVKQAVAAPLEHDREKKRFVDIERPFLTKLGVTDSQHNLIPAMSRKWKQINKFIEVFSQALEASPHKNDQPINVVDFGSGKGYLTFAIHDYLRHSLHNDAQVTGVELRQALADLCNETAATLDHQGLSFVCGDVRTHAPKQTDVMIALHACDIATDYAIHYGIRANADIIMCSPCCHKQIRPQMHSPELFKPMLQYGVHMGQQAEMVTDSLRALFLEANGYATKVFEFISLEHTNKNKMILAVKKPQHNQKDSAAILAQIADIKAYYGIKEHCLETLLAQTQAD
ncbi:SAM-dependent methyltransferase [Shewanella sp. SW36]|uniref:class I SAM-dependent methyltransferase n=1 Tax=unclassified Shewanella TaxID=196818 RepID=UPI0018E3351F|nr:MULTISPECIES: SAM-dependent methyltransferase [unclassified Shewanella]MBI1673304.1 SAM-dependent methyltransferase [Shewanella sp. DW31]MCU7974580.1 SAM-dependent methyltransferase [Shewanella sp. SW36]MCU7989968.1 SAM-dependent methyltransferase [Shewanella sp. SW1]MCU8017350.1 SAM-dependent methyltransferase [Shewanella sp. SM72]MCU8051365.1 SAM-dependent methyltransferase [Shewanella sp. SM43]